MDYAALTGETMPREALGYDLFTATDGNHGRGWLDLDGAGWAAARWCDAEGHGRCRVENIRALGAEVTVEDLNYDGCVRLAAQQAAQTPGSVVVQDTAWPVYEQIPLHIMQGQLTTMALEADEQLDAPPTHIFLQAGVGSMAAAVAYLRKTCPARRGSSSSSQRRRTAFRSAARAKSRPCAARCRR